ncbi:hypothetical protein HYH03_006110 [Edaphochlamys debaryana]|uniref:Malonyl-CoA decarboxylase n=1 Tax=Edaphochlamys debaryana TaxID=47281 RepID=A0A835Y3M4_9CHLO|nr:hypothetical protein HYH03_006110 [Edaphochlamys debaryana]|eukprot:KAG2495872.1 hypothetical protein HYH03_006110 [Edaphochlamys debaryana]
MRREATSGTNSVEELLRRHRQVLDAFTSSEHAAPGHPGFRDGTERTARDSAPSGNSLAASSTGKDANSNAGNNSSALVKELLRIFSRRVPGALVPDGLVRGLMQAYGELRTPSERLGFFGTLQREMGLSVPEVRAAVRLWDGALARAGPAPPASSDASTPASTSTSSASPTASLSTAPTSAPAPTEAVLRAADRLASAARPLYAQLFAPISQAPGGMKFLVDMRAELMALGEGEGGQGQGQGEGQKEGGSIGGGAEQASPAALRAMADQLRQALAEWFSVGLLQVQPISWEESSAALLERVMAAEAVHPLRGSWPELRRRLGPRRRVFALLHPCMPGEPLVVLHTALMERAASSMAEILDPSTAASPASPSTAPPTAAVFYSISASQPGLRGIDLGHGLIKQAAQRLRAEYPSLEQLVTLSPLPSFRPWLTSRLRQLEAGAAAGQAAGGQAAAAAEAGAGSGGGGEGEPLLTSADAAAVLGLARQLGWTGGGGGGGAESSGSGRAGPAAAAALRWILEDGRWLDPDLAAPGTAGAAPATGSSPGSASVAGPSAGPGWARAGPGGPEAVLRPLLLRLAARYLVREKRRRFALCPVAHFHLRNGASMWRLNWRADMSALGLQRSYGIMVNYSYDLATVNRNNELYLLAHEVQAGPQVAQWLQPPGAA